MEFFEKVNIFKEDLYCRSKPSSPVDEEINSRASDSAAEDSRPGLSNSALVSSTKQEAVEPNMYESVKQRHQAKKQATVVAQKKAKNAVACKYVEIYLFCYDVVFNFRLRVAGFFKKAINPIR